MAIRGICCRAKQQRCAPVMVSKQLILKISSKPDKCQRGFAKHPKSFAFTPKSQTHINWIKTLPTNKCQLNRITTLLQKATQKKLGHRELRPFNCRVVEVWLKVSFSNNPRSKCRCSGNRARAPRVAVSS